MWSGSDRQRQRHGAVPITEHLISASAIEEIAHVTDAEDTSTGRERLRGYRDALDAGGVWTFSQELVVRTTVDRIGGYRAAQEILARPSSDGYFCGQQHDRRRHDGGIARAWSFTVPGEMGLVCFDDVEHLAVLSPFLTVIDQPAETFGSLGAQLLLERMTGKASSIWPAASSCRLT